MNFVGTSYIASVNIVRGMHPDAEEFAEMILSDDLSREPGSELAQETDSTMAALLNLLGKKHTISILHQFACSDGPLRFSDLEEIIDIAPNTLSTRLTELTEVGLLTRQAYNEIPPRVEYESTNKARDLAPVFWYLGVWTDRHDLD
jgi:DNA-binding HxlR family transcriptional regulator